MFRLFRSEFGGQVSWLLPAALIALVAMVWVSWRSPRADRTRAAALIWGGWVLVTGGVFSYMNGIIHPYYMVALAPGIGALAGIGAMSLWQTRLLGVAGRVVLAGGLVVSGWWAFVLLARTAGWLPWLRWVVVIAAVSGAALVLGGGAVVRWLAAAGSSRRLVLGAVPVATVVLALVAGLGGPAAYALDTVNTAHSGAIPSAGPASGLGTGGGPGGGGVPGGAGAGTRPAGAGPGASGAGSTGTGPTGTGSRNPGTGTGNSPSRTGRGGNGGLGAGGGGAGGGGGAAGLGGNTQVSSALAKLLEQDASSYKWVAAAEGSESAAPLELATGDAVIAIGGFNGTDPWPTLAAFKELVAKHEVHYYIGQGGGSFGGGSGSSEIASWVAAHFKKLTVGGETVYDLAQPTTSS